ncbi:protein OCTOPUS-like [Bidens hawaiensis]|uniref:protein OCTOPUS-like n=1 Tax=Bidens hawaiensis TaxID=980011 RepID=UPI00404B4F25
MNPPTDQPPPPPLPSLQPPRSSFSCHRHPDENFTGFCPECLCERLTTLDQSAANAAAGSSSRRNSTSSATAAASAAAAIKSIFRVTSASSEVNKNKAPATREQVTRNSNSFFPELRRTKSFSAAKAEGLLGFSAGGYEPQRKSCDVRGRNTLSSLFSIHDENKPPRLSYSQQTLAGNGVVLETNREEEEEEEQCHINDEIEEDGVIRVSEELDVVEINDLGVNNNNNNIIEETVEMKEPKELIFDELKPMKDHIDLDSHSKKPSRSNFWSAASVLSKKWHKWRRKQKKDVSGSNGVVLSSTLPVEKPLSRQFRETQSEIADYGFGRRSCDTDPRFSLDAGRISFDDPRYSFDEPRASWDGYLVGRTFPRLPPMVEDAPAPASAPAPVVHVARCDSQIPVEEVSVFTDNVPGGSIQTREYYLDSSSKRRKSLDRSNSIRRMAAAVVAELDESKVNPVISNTKVSPATVDYGNYSNGVSIDPPRVSNSNSLRDDCSETFELGFRDRDNAVPVEKKENKKPRKWRWKLWGFIHRRSNNNKDDDEDRCSSVSGVGRSYSESWQDGNNEGFLNNRKVFRSNSSVSWRSSSLRNPNLNPNPNNINGKAVGNEHALMNGNGNGKSRRTGDEFVLERSRSTRYSPNNIDNGLLRFYLAPLSGSRRSGVGISSGKTRATGNSHLFSRNMLGLY